MTKESTKKHLNKLKENKCPNDAQENTNIMAEWNDENNSGFENQIQERDRNIEENSSWNGDGIEKLNTLIRKLGVKVNRVVQVKDRISGFEDKTKEINHISNGYKSSF